MMFVDFATARSQLASPGIRALAVASNTDFPGLPGVPPIAASGYPGFESWAWMGLVAPAGTSPDIVTKLRNSYLATVADPETRKKLTDAGFDILQSTPTEFTDYVRSETVKWDRVIKNANIRVE
jgi:tripartite-type tricarboxylate transporter receptor subunit TctC